MWCRWLAPCAGRGNRFRLARCGQLAGLDDFRAAALRLPFGVFAAADFRAPPIRKSSILCPAFSAAASQRALRPRPAHVPLGLSELRYFGATAPNRRPRLRPPAPPKRESFPSSASTVRRVSTIFALRVASTSNSRRRRIRDTLLAKAGQAKEQGRAALGAADPEVE